LCPDIFGNTNYLINKTVPFGKHPGPTDGSDRELLDSYWYCKTYDEQISDPETEFLFPIEVYVNKTGKTAGLQSYCGEPMTWSTPLLNQSIHQSDKAWRAMGYIPDLEVSPSTKKKKANGANMTKGRSLRNYHQVLDAVLFSLIDCQEARGFDAYVCMGDYIRYMKVIPVVCFMIGDAKSSDALCCQFGGKNCKGRVPRLCLTPMKDLDNPMHYYTWIHALDLESIYEKAAQEGETREQKMEIKKHRDALKAMSTHFCDNALFQVDFSYNPLGVTLATPTDMMHLFESGMIPRVLRSFVRSMSSSVQGQVDDLIE
jgi:hypothetical protein